MKYSRSRYGSVSEGPTVVNDRKDGYFGINDYGREPNSRSNFPMSFSEEVIRDVQEMITKYRKLIPFIVVLKLVIIAIGLVYAYKFSFSELSDSSLIVGESDCTDECPRFVTRPNCTDANYPVLGGLDFVQYFTFENENMTGLIGNPNISTIYNGYEFYFLSEDNRAIFESDPEKYSPQYGGFCAWGIAGEYCPNYYWSKNCLGPSGNWGIWTMYQDKLYFFFLQSAKELFMADPEYYSVTGADRWNGWFSGTNDDSTEVDDDTQSGLDDDNKVDNALRITPVVFNSLCYHNSSSFVVRHKPVDASSDNMLPYPPVIAN